MFDQRILLLGSFRPIHTRHSGHADCYSRTSAGIHHAGLTRKLGGSIDPEDAIDGNDSFSFKPLATT